MILLENVLIDALRAAGIQATIQESVDWKSDYVLLSRTGGSGNIGGATTGWSNREEVEVQFSTYSLTRSRALELGYKTQEVLENISTFTNRVSNPSLDGLSESADFNEQYSYTFGGSFTVNKANT